MCQVYVQWGQADVRLYYCLTIGSGERDNVLARGGLHPRANIISLSIRSMVTCLYVIIMHTTYISGYYQWRIQGKGGLLGLQLPIPS